MASLYETQQWKAFRTRIINQRGAWCEICLCQCTRGTERLPTQIQVHHIEPGRLRFFDPTNVLILCRRCHRAVHGVSETHNAIFWQDSFHGYSGKLNGDQRPTVNVQSAMAQRTNGTKLTHKPKIWPYERLLFDFDEKTKSLSAQIFSYYMTGEI